MIKHPPTQLGTVPLSERTGACSKNHCAGRHFQLPGVAWAPSSHLRKNLGDMEQSLIPKHWPKGFTYKRTHQASAYKDREICWSISSSSRSQNQDPYILQSRSRCLILVLHFAREFISCWTEWIILLWAWPHGSQVPIGEALFIHTLVHSFPLQVSRDFQMCCHRFSHLCYFLVHNKDPPTFIFFNEPLNGEKCSFVLSHVLMWTWFQMSKWFCLIMIYKGSLFSILQAGSQPRSKKEGVRGREPRAG